MPLYTIFTLWVCSAEQEVNKIHVTKPNAAQTNAHARALHLDYFAICLPGIKAVLFYRKLVD
jgi:hypothetical protein